MPIKERLKIEKQLEQEFGLTSNNTDGNRGFGNFFYRGEPSTGGEKMIDTGTLPYLAKYIREGRTENFGSKNADDFVANFGMEKTQEIGDLVAKLQEGQLPDFPFKKDWVDIAVKEALKIGAEKGVDRVAFTNAATQINRNYKNLNYVQDIIVNKLPTRKELPNTLEFAEQYKANLKTRYDDYINTQHDTNLPIPTQEEYYASLPAAQKKLKELEAEDASILAEIDQRILDDIARFRQKYPDADIDRTIELLDRGGDSNDNIAIFYQNLRDDEIKTLSNRANDAFDITSDPRNVDVTNPALARLLDAELEFNQTPKDVDKKLKRRGSIFYESNKLEGFANVDEKRLKEITVEQLAKEFRLDDYKYKLENVGYKLEGDEILNPQRIQMEGDDYDNQRFGQRMLTNEEELLEEVPEQFREQVKKDLAAGKSSISLNIDDLEGSGKKFLEIYKNEIPRGIVKALKDLKVKDVKPSISDVLYSADDVDPNRIVEMFKKQEVANEEGGYVLEAFIQPHSSIGIDLTDEMREKILREGLPSMYMGGKVSKSNSMDRPIGGNRRENVMAVNYLQDYLGIDPNDYSAMEQGIAGISPLAPGQSIIPQAPVMPRASIMDEDDFASATAPLMDRVYSREQAAREKSTGLANELQALQEEMAQTSEAEIQKRADLERQIQNIMQERDTSRTSAEDLANQLQGLQSNLQEVTELRDIATQDYQDAVAQQDIIRQQAAENQAIQLEEQRNSLLEEREGIITTLEQDFGVQRSELESVIGGLEGQVGDLTSKVGELESVRGSLEGQINDLSSQMQNLETEKQDALAQQDIIRAESAQAQQDALAQQGEQFATERVL